MEVNDAYERTSSGRAHNFSNDTAVITNRFVREGHAMGRFFVRLDVAPHPDDRARSVRRFHVVCTSCNRSVETYTAQGAEDRDLRHSEARMSAENMLACEVCGAGSTPVVVEPDAQAAAEFL